MDAARATRRTPPPQQEYEERSRTISRARCIRCTATRPSTPRAARARNIRSRSSSPTSRHEPDPSRYDDALYGQIESGEQDYQRDPAYPDDPYAYQGGYDEEPEQPRKRAAA